ncbi:pilus assembly protein N-terminal domain-containing protein [Hyphomicrobium facile]
MPRATPRSIETAITSSFTNSCGNYLFLEIAGCQMLGRSRRTATPQRAIRGIACASLIALAGMPAAAGDLVVRYDQSQLLRLPRPASEIIVGNPSIADVTLQDGNLVVVTGKTFGITNIIALDNDHNVIQDQRVMVERDDRRIVNLHKGSQRFTYACTPNCEPTLTIGDEKDFFDNVKSANTSKTKFSEGSADQGANANNQQ